jgi:hypothetical protein
MPARVMKYCGVHHGSTGMMYSSANTSTPMLGSDTLSQTRVYSPRYVYLTRHVASRAAAVLAGGQQCGEQSGTIIDEIGNVGLRDVSCVECHLRSKSALQTVSTVLSSTTSRVVQLVYL